MTKSELDNMINWCRQKIKNERSNPFGYHGNKLEVYETAMKSVMSYLHSLKEKCNE